MIVSDEDLEKACRAYLGHVYGAHRIPDDADLCFERAAMRAALSTIQPAGDVVEAALDAISIMSEAANVLSPSAITGELNAAAERLQFVVLALGMEPDNG